MYVIEIFIQNCFNYFTLSETLHNCVDGAELEEITAQHVLEVTEG